jgi:hypothetical protein
MAKHARTIDVFGIRLQLSTLLLPNGSCTQDISGRSNHERLPWHCKLSGSRLDMVAAAFSVTFFWPSFKEKYSEHYTSHSYDTNWLFALADKQTSSRIKC